MGPDVIVFQLIFHSLVEVASLLGGGPSGPWWRFAARFGGGWLPPALAGLPLRKCQNYDPSDSFDSLDDYHQSHHKNHINHSSDSLAGSRQSADSLDFLVLFLPKEKEHIQKIPSGQAKNPSRSVKIPCSPPAFYEKLVFCKKKLPWLMFMSMTKS
jgi:hypothetical protein